MRYAVSVCIIVAVACLAISTCYALTVKDNGYKWNSADVSDRADVCKRIASKIGRDFRWWFEALNERVR